MMSPMSMGVQPGLMLALCMFVPMESSMTLEKPSPSLSACASEALRGLSPLATSTVSSMPSPSSLHLHCFLCHHRCQLSSQGSVFIQFAPPVCYQTVSKASFSRAGTAPKPLLAPIAIINIILPVSKIPFFFIIYHPFKCFMSYYNSKV